ncbi:MAG TPA: TetR/AcrR family transcriptional regulator [Hyphomonas sp.]|nr:TetR/AcrR family transcriptional regulator [Hyphomonas sp.]HRX74083.1 TetR/AcrR family transcriptional regulator [Hyphomonas sp.]
MDTDYPSDQTPAVRRRQKVRDSILAAAERVFAKEGESGLSIRRLAEEIDYSPSAIYKYFGSKEELLEELKEAFFDRLMAQVDRVAALNLDFHDRARACVTTYVATAVERPHHYAAAFSSIPTAEEAAARQNLGWEDFIQTSKGQAFKVLVDLVEDGQARGVFDRTLEPVKAAKSIWASSHGLALLMIHMPVLPDMQPCEAQPTGDFVAFHADIVMRGLAVPASTPQQNGAST